TSRSGVTVTWTPLSTFTGYLPIRDIFHLPDCSDQFATDIHFFRLSATENTFICAQDRRAKTVAHVRDLTAIDIHTTSRAAHSLQLLDCRFAVTVVQINTHNALFCITNDFEVADVTCFFENF